MKLVFLTVAILINFFNHSLIKSEEKVEAAKNTIENIAKKESITEIKTEIKRIHIVKSGETLSSISKLYSINKDLIIKLNSLKDPNYIYVGQNLIISASTENPLLKSDLLNSYHIVQVGENLTEISNKYNLNIGYLLEINNLKNPDSLKVGKKILLTRNDKANLENDQTNKKNNGSLENKLLKSEQLIYGPLTIENKSFKKFNGKIILNVLNQENKKLILSINCDTNELDIRVPGRKWMGGEPAKKEFEKNLINDFC